jgi:hypothetical protein
MDNEQRRKQSMRNKTYTFFADGGHAWLKVTRAELIELEVVGISRYSYQFNDNVYLEEDCDAGKFIDAYERRFGYKPSLRESHTNRLSRIRSYTHFTVEPPAFNRSKHS